MNSWGDMHTFLLDNVGRVYRYWVYRRMFTPYEQQRAFSDESFFEDTTARYGIISEAVDLGGGDYLLGFSDPDSIDSAPDERYIEYHRLSDIRINFSPGDQYERNDQD